MKKTRTPFFEDAIMKTAPHFSILALSFCCLTTARAVTIDYVPIGNAGNAADDTGYGAVAYDYKIGATEVTNAQYVEFLNAVAVSDPYGLYNEGFYNNQGPAQSTQSGITRSGSSGSYEYAVKPDDAGYTYANKPVTFISWYDAVRFTNWLGNGQGNGDTETGAYTLLGGTATPSNGLTVTRNAGATVWLPSKDEWYKAAYHDASAGTDGTYFEYPTGTDTPPNNNLPTSDTGNSANFDSGFDNPSTGTFDYPFTDAGAYLLSSSSYGTYDQGGNAWEWGDTLIDSSKRSLTGGALYNTSFLLSASFTQGAADPTAEGGYGFRLATAAVPEPISMALLALGGCLIPFRRKR